MATPKLNSDKPLFKGLTMIQEYFALLVARALEELDLILLELVTSFFMILTGTQPWINRLKIDAIELDKQETSPYIVLLLSTA
jgi:hypothetical protein